MLRRNRLVSPISARKILHIGAISISAISVLFFNRNELLLIIGIAIPILAFAVFSGFFKDEKSGRKSFGILFFALSFFALVFFFGEAQPELVFYPMFILAWADGLATVVGYKFGKTKLDFSPEGKTVEGTCTFFLVAFIVLFFGKYVHPLYDLKISWQFALYVSAFLALLEALSIKSFDNIWVPGAVAYWLLLSSIDETLVYSLAIPVLAFFAFRQNWLTSGGATAATLLGWIFLINPNPEFMVFPILFFLIGSILSKLPGHSEEASDRNANQVFANGGIPALFFMAYFVWQDPVFMVAGISGFAFALSDTAASEIGIRMGGQHFRIIGGRKVDPGLSGAVTLSGSLTGLFFACFIAAVALLPIFEFSLVHCFIIAVAGVSGNIADSLIGDWLQAKYRDEDGAIREYSVDRDEKPIRGYRWITNGTTNFLASAFSCLMACIAAVLI